MAGTAQGISHNEQVKRGTYAGSMRRAVLHGPRDLRIEPFSLDTDRLEPNQIWVQTEITALKIGTDRGNYEGAAIVPGAPNYPRWVGDSNLGIVRGAGEKVCRFAPGDRVFSRRPHQSDYIATESEAIIKIPDTIASEDAVYLGLYHMSALSYWTAHYQPGENVAVVGLGVLGVAAVALGKAFGARVLALGNSSIRLEMARAMGADLALLSSSPETFGAIGEYIGEAGVDLVILTANPWPAYRLAVEIVRSNGRVSVLALPGRGEPQLDFNPFSMEWFYAKNLTLMSVGPTPSSLYPVRGNRFDLEATAPALLALMAAGSVEPKRVITHRFSCERMVDAYEMAFAREKSMLGVVFQWR